MRSIDELEKALNIKIHNRAVFELALTHPSYNADANTKHQDYERLEYMGDAVLDYVSADIIFKKHPEMDQGLMSKLRSYLVKTKTLSQYARRINLAEYIRVGHSIAVANIFREINTPVVLISRNIFASAILLPSRIYSARSIRPSY